MSVDLRKFCGDPERKIGKPFSRGEFTYAVNGHIGVRVPRLADVPEDDKAPAAELIFRFDDVEFFPVEPPTLPPTEMVDCPACHGRGSEHDCPDCTCRCGKCNGATEIDISRETSASVGGVPFNVAYLRLMFDLPDLMLPKSVHPTNPLRFKFDGGHGLIMPRRNPCPEHLELEDFNKQFERSAA